MENIQDDFDVGFKDLEIFLDAMKTANERASLVLMYRPPDASKQSFLYQLQDQVERVTRQEFCSSY